MQFPHLDQLISSGSELIRGPRKREGVYTYFGFRSSHFFRRFLQVRHPERLQLPLPRKSGSVGQGEWPTDDRPDGLGGVAMQSISKLPRVTSLRRKCLVT